jgi:pilin isopeptide linkage protein
MKRNVFKALAIVMTLALIVTFAAVAASAYTPVAGSANAHYFKKYLIVDQDATVPTITFQYSIAPGEGIPAQDGRMEVLPGIAGATVGSASFTSTDSTNTTVTTGDQVTLDAGEKYATKQVYFDFSGVSFPEPGIYRYVVTETSAGQDGVSYDTQAAAGATAKTRYLDVYVIDENGGLVVSEYVMHYQADNVITNNTNGSNNPTPLADKSDGFVNEYSAKSLEFGKEVTGNQGSKDKYFKYTLVISGAPANTTYPVDLTDASATSGTSAATVAANQGQTNPTSVTVDENGSATVYFYLKDGEYITVKDLLEGTTYTLTEDAEDYSPADGITTAVNGGRGDYTDATSGTIDGNIKTGFTNTRDGVVPTGVLITIAPFVIGLLLFGAVIFFITSKRRREAY